MVYVFTGEGKGKTSAALGVSVRGLLQGWKVCWISFYKSESWAISEKKMVDKFPKLDMYWVGEGFYIPERDVQAGVKVAKVNKGKVVDSKGVREHRKGMEEGLEIAREKLRAGDCQLLVLDEINKAVRDGLVKLNEVFELLGARGGAHVVLTGRGMDEEIVKMADLVTECRSVKHPYDKGEVAVKGLDY